MAVENLDSGVRLPQADLWPVMRPLARLDDGSPNSRVAVIRSPSGEHAVTTTSRRSRPSGSYKRDQQTRVGARPLILPSAIGTATRCMRAQVCYAGESKCLSLEPGVS